MSCQHCCEHTKLTATKGGHCVTCEACGKRWEEPQTPRIRQSNPFPFGGTTLPAVQLAPNPPRPGEIKCITRRDGVVTHLETW